MRSTLLVLVLGVVALVLCGCPLVPPPEPTVAGVAPTCTTSDLMNKVRYLQTPFDPRVNSFPQPSSLGVPANIQSDLQSAFAIAPASFRAKLCDLTYIFIDPTGCSSPLSCTLPDDQLAHNSWGLRGYRNGDNGKYIATSAGLWRNGGSAPKLSDYAFGRLRALLQLLNPNGSAWLLAPSAPRFATATPDTSAMAVLAALAHETGHVYWYDAFVPVRGGGINLNNFCGGRFYTAGSWSNIDVPVGRWTEFARSSANATHIPNYASSLNSYLSQRNFVLAGATLQQMIQNQDLAGVLAAFSPDEDFVEAYEWHVLLNAAPPLSNLTIQIPGVLAYNIAAGMPNKRTLRNKMACF